MTNENKPKIEGKLLSSLVKVFPDEEPKGEETGNSMLANEWLNFQIALKNNHWDQFRFLSIKAEGTLAPYITFRTVELVPSSFTVVWTDDYYLRSTPGMYPDLLKPIGPMGIVLPCHQWRSIWVSVHAEKGLPAGKYETHFTVAEANGNVVAEFDYTVEVLDVKSVSATLPVTNWMHYDCIAQQHGVKPFSKGFYKVFENYLKTYVESGCTMLLTPLFTPPLDTKVGAERMTAQLVKVIKTGEDYSFDFTALEKFIRFARKRGIQYFELSHLFTQWGGEYCPKIMAWVDGEEKRIFGWDVASDSKAYTAFLDAFLPALMGVLEKLKVRDKCFAHLTDEPNENHLENYRKCRAAVKKHIGDMPVMDALSEYEFYKDGLVDVPVASTPAYDKKYAKNGVTDIFAYYCCGPTAEYYSNRIVNMPSQRTRMLGFQLYATGATGFLHWGYNFYNSSLSVYPIDPYATTDAGGFFPSGDGFIVYPSENGVHESIRSEMMKEAFQDYRAMQTLEHRIGREKAVALLTEWGVSGFNVYPHTAEGHLAFRRKINELLATRS